MMKLKERELPEPKVIHEYVGENQKITIEDFGEEITDHYRYAVMHQVVHPKAVPIKSTIHRTDNFSDAMVAFVQKILSYAVR